VQSPACYRVTAILYFAIQWKYASRIAPNRVFSASRMTDQVGMAIEETEVAARTRLVLDANILMRGIPGNQSSLSCLKNTKIPSRSTAPSASCCRDIRSYWKEKAVSHPFLVAKNSKDSVNADFQVVLDTCGLGTWMKSSDPTQTDSDRCRARDSPRYGT
jgi:hypothetical protein